VSKVFVEYQILPQHRSVYSLWIQNVRDKSLEMELLEGVDQPGLFIEIWSGCNREAFFWMKKMRKNDPNLVFGEFGQPFEAMDIDWRRMDEWIIGGIAKINIWHFIKVR
jgi:hypothetical protein